MRAADYKNQTVIYQASEWRKQREVKLQTKSQSNSKKWKKARKQKIHDIYRHIRDTSNTSMAMKTFRVQDQANLGLQ